MATVTYNGESYSCATAIKGDDYIHLLNDAGIMCAAFDGITDFSLFEITDGAWTDPKSHNDCHVAVIREDGTIAAGGHTCRDISNHTHAASNITAGTLAGQVVANATAQASIGVAQVRNIYAGTADLTAGSSALPTGTIYIVYE